MKYAYKNTNFAASSIETIEQANSIIEKYQAMGYTLTLRQLYYQMVAADLIQNTMKSYKRVASIINDARWSGLVDWSAIEDRARNTVTPSTWASPRNIMRGVLQSYREDLWENQPTHIEVMCEKDAVSNIIEPVCNELGVRFTANRGYPSASLLYDVSQRLEGKSQEWVNYNPKTIVIIYLGDHDPSGMDMDNDIKKRFDLFAEEQYEIDFTRLALTMDQVNKWQPPRNPAKMSDSRFKKYAEEYGTASWELDAIKAEDMSSLVRSEIEAWIDDDLWEKARVAQEANLAKLSELSEKL